jgi:hypothetical protein
MLWGEFKVEYRTLGEQGNATVALTGIGLTTDLGQRDLGSIRMEFFNNRMGWSICSTGSHWSTN